MTTKAETSNKSTGGKEMSNNLVETIKDTQTLEKYLSNKTVVLRPVPRPDLMMPEVGKNPRHVGYFKYDGTVDSFVLPIDARTGRYKNPFSSLEEERLFSARFNDDLSVTKRNSPFWKRFSVRILKDQSLMENGLSFNLSDPFQNLQWRILCMYPTRVHTDPSTLDSNPVCNYVLTDATYEIQKKVEKSNINKEAYKALGKIENSATTMISLLRLKGNIEEIKTTIDTVGADVSRDFLIAEIEKWIEKDPKDFLNVVKDPNTEIKSFIQEAISIGEIVRDNSIYRMPAGDVIGRSLSETVDFFNAADNQDIYIRIKAKINASLVK